MPIVTTKKSTIATEQLRYSDDELRAFIRQNLIATRPELEGAHVEIEFGLEDSDPYYPEQNIKSYHADVTVTQEVTDIAQRVKCPCGSGLEREGTRGCYSCDR